MNIQFTVVSTYEECTHILIEENNVQKLNAFGVKYGKVYNLLYDQKEEEYYIVNDEGKGCIAFDTIIQVKLLRQNIK
ncbi:hypothetical protein [Bacillus andreraoultii]|uniref:hypothetical protein n=1 Tax=Bacillus andreraoultii TaxID=1499685 RepID=UPI00053A2171|nr:hypothetical protein [Bacillus andreraoultii]